MDNLPLISQRGTYFPKPKNKTNAEVLVDNYYLNPRVPSNIEWVERAYNWAENQGGYVDNRQTPLWYENRVFETIKTGKREKHFIEKKVENWIKNYLWQPFVTPADPFAIIPTKY